MNIDHVQYMSKSVNQNKEPTKLYLSHSSPLSLSMMELDKKTCQLNGLLKQTMDKALSVVWAGS